MAKFVLWLIVVCIYMGIYQNYKHHIENSRWGIMTLIAIVCFIAILEVIERRKNL